MLPGMPVRNLVVDNIRVHCQAHRCTSATSARTRWPLEEQYRRLHIRATPLERVYRRSTRSAFYCRLMSVFFSPRYDILLQSLHKQELRFIRQRLPGENGPIQRILSLVSRFSRFDRKIERVFHESHHEHSLVAIRERSKLVETIQLGKHRPQELVFRRESAEKLVRARTVHTVAGESSAMSPRLLTAPVQREIIFAQSRPASLPAELNPHELQRLTDRVLETLDHRILATRERLGRT